MGIFVNRITRRLSFLVAVSCLNPIAAGLLAQALPPPELITDRQGLPQAFVPDILQDRQGFIWAATRDGLCRYDGLRFKVFQPRADGRPSLSFAGVSRLSLDHREQIWITSELGHLDRFDPVSERFLTVSRQPAYEKAMGQQKPAFFCLDRQDYYSGPRFSYHRLSLSGWLLT